MLVKKQTIHQVDRPLAHCVIGYLLGIISGNILHQKMYVSFIIWILLIGIGLLVYASYYTIESIGKVIFCIVLGLLLFMNFSLHQEEDYFKSGEKYTLHGQISQINKSSYYQWVTLKNVQDCETKKQFKNKVRVCMPLTHSYLSSYDEITIEAEVIEPTPQMNPSDFDYNMYLKSEGILATLKANTPITYTNLLTNQQFLDYKEQTPLIEKLQLKLYHQLEQLFINDVGQLSEQMGIIEACLLGKDLELSHQTKEIYQQAGISHVLCISGFHVGVMISVVMGIIIIFSHFCFIPYSLRQLVLLLAIWRYAILTGGAVSTIRAAQMITVVLIGKCLWQETDELTNLAIAAFIILFLNPYQLFRVGFQLSFSAVLGILLCQMQMEKKERDEMKVYTSMQQKGLMWISIQLFTLPILAYHFYTVPFALSLLNLIIIPLFAIIIIVSWGLVGLSFMMFPIAKLGMEGITWILSCIEKSILILSKQMPFATLCVGKPTLFKYSIYIGFVILIGRLLWKSQNSKKLYSVILIMGCLYFIMSFYQLLYPNQTLKITSLYVGQGDCTVIELPKYGLFVIDGGDFGKGSTLKNYIQYLGYQQVEGIMISHCDDDHIGGILELLDTAIEVRHLFLTEDKENKNFVTLMNKCKEKEIAVHYLEQGDCLKYDKVIIECLAPNHNQDNLNSNDKSILCQLSYKDFKMLFTGDKPIEFDQAIYDSMNPITILKVSHHGSRTGTSAKMLAQLQPQYAVVSCGIHNIYHHPHQEVLELLEDSNIEVSRTDQDGAIFYETDGHYLNKQSFRQLERKYKDAMLFTAWAR